MSKLRDKTKTINTLSLFTGAGGLDIGFHQEGFNVIACVEIEAAYAKSLEANKLIGKYISPQTSIHNQDIRKFDAAVYANRGIECVIGGPPCQTFSAAGRRSGGVLGTADARGRLFESYCDILKIIEPKVFVFENVYGLPGANDGGPWKEIREAFHRLGYTLRAEVLDAADYGVPQHRERLIIVGFREGEGNFEFPMPTHGPDSRDARPLVSVLDAISDLQDDDEAYHELDGLYGHLLSLVPEGLNYSFFTREMGYPKPYFAWRSKFHDFLYKVNRHSPSRTIKAQPGKFTGPFHWKNRHFKVEELKRLQTFPDDYEIVGTFGKIMEQVGNSVPPRLARTIASSVREQLLRPTKSLTYETRHDGFKSTFRQRQRERTFLFKERAAAEVAARFPNVQLLDQSKLERSSSYYVGFKGLFSRQVSDNLAHFELGREYYSVAFFQKKDAISLKISPVHSATRKSHEVRIELNGLSKYLLHIDSVTVDAKFFDLDDIFRVWAIVEESLKANSQFFTLIDIYGHYANRGDTVKISTKIHASRKTRLERAIEFFGTSENCGDFITLDNASTALGVKKTELNDLIADMRGHRWDVRTQETHNTIRQSAVLCTYPFPLLSDKAQLERRFNDSVVA
ncbi:DNA cytosine methyltransferase [Paraburkholderia dilworthii]|uniref:Cytosine-specific methyltransferase n=1 Tax=Paraburkholderia dilworthii TaxID=948106 RepID=A0ABW9DIE2_9BURK